MRILITGITGRVGANLAARLTHEGHSVRGLVWPRDPRTEKLKELGVELNSGTITDPGDAETAVQGMDVVYHLAAAFQGGGPFTEQEYFDINVRGTFNMLEAARKVSTLKHFCYAGTDAVYPKYIAGGLKVPITEESPKEPAGSYALTKSLGEDLCMGYWRGHQLPVTIVRFANVFGAGEILSFPQFFLSHIKSRPEASCLWTGDERLVILTDEIGRPYKKHVADVRDIVGGCTAVLNQAMGSGHVIQLAAPEAFTWDAAIPLLSKGLDIEYVTVSLTGVPTYYEFDLSRAHSVLEFVPQFGIERMIDDALRFQRGEDIGLLKT